MCGQFLGVAPRVLVIDDDDYLRKFISRGLNRVGMSAEAVEGGARAMSQMKEQQFDVVVCDLHMPEVDGLDVLRFSASLRPAPPFIMLTGYGSVQVAVEAMKHGAADFLEKPISIDELKAAIQAVMNKHAERTAPRRVNPIQGAPGLVGSATWLPSFLETLRRIAQTDATVLIEGETGTGKSAVAREIYRSSKRAGKSFVELNCAAIPEHLLENELFGHVRGAFTGATGHVGKVEQANGGTLFLDEVGELKHELQAKMLHLLQERAFAPIGANQVRSADVRFIAATNRDLITEVEAGTFRQDLFYRLNVVNLIIPPLRDRPADISLLLEHFCDRIAERLQVTGPVFSPGAVELLERYEWPGNVRELQNLVERTAIMHPPGTLIEPEHLSARIHQNQREPSSDPTSPPRIEAFESDIQQIEESGQSLSDVVRSYEYGLIRQALDQSGGNKSQAAKLLRMKRTTLIEKLKKYEHEDGSPNV